MVPHIVPALILYLNFGFLEDLAEQNTRKMQLGMTWFKFFEIQ
jgi:hypothetical protein